MALAERDPNGSGRTSRASNMSVGSKSLLHKAPLGVRNDMFSSAPGVASMLRTSTELGNLGGIAYDSSSNLPNVPRASYRSGATSRMSTGSSRSNQSRRESRRASGQHNVRPSSSSGPRHSMTRNSNMPQYIPDTLSPTVMDLPGSSPLVPRTRSSRDGGRCRSMTHTSHPNFGLASNRSYSSLRTHDIVQRPRSPYEGYPQQLRRSGGPRPVSPATSDYADTVPRRSMGNQAWSRMRIPSDASVRRDQRGQMAPPSRARSPAFYANPQHHADVPPVPQIPLYHQHRAVPQVRTMHKQTGGSASSASTNQRADSEAPSSEGPSPPTPKDGVSLATLVSPAGAQVVIDSVMGNSNVNRAVPLYYGGGEYYEHEVYATEEGDTVVTGFSHKIKTIVEERASVESPFKSVPAAYRTEISQRPAPHDEIIAELPASPVSRRITRELILSVIGQPASPTEYVDLSAPYTDGDNAGQSAFMKSEDPDPCGILREGATVGCYPPKLCQDHRRINSQVESGLLDSSTVELAVRYASPAASGAATGTGTGNSTTEDSMSDLLNDYQHTEMKEDLDTDEVGSPAPRHTEEKKCHIPKSSDAQSFKLCTGLTGRPEQPGKDSDGKSFRTCLDTVTPDRPAVSAGSKLPSSGLGKPEPRVQVAGPEMLVSSPPAVLRKKPPMSLRDSTFPKANSRTRANSKLASRHGSTVTLTSSSFEGSGHQPPPVPPRDSSTSKEAQRTAAVASYLLRGFRSGGKFTSFGKRSAKNGASPLDGSDDVSLSESHTEKEQSAPTSPIHGSGEAFGSSEKTLFQRDVVAKESTSDGLSPQASASSDSCTPTQASNAQQKTPAHHRPLDTSSAALVEPSSVYSPEYNSSSSRFRTQSSPPELSKSPEHSRRDSQTTKIGRAHV